MPRFLILVIIFLLALAPAPTLAGSSAPESPFDGFDEFIEEVRAAIPFESSVDDIVFTRVSEDMTEAGAATN